VRLALRGGRRAKMENRKELAVNGHGLVDSVIAVPNWRAYNGPGCDALECFHQCLRHELDC
jgi:hypothetical protein